MMRALEAVLSMRSFGRMAMLAASMLSVPACAFAEDAASQPLAWQRGAVNATVTPTASADGKQVGGTSRLELDTAGLQAAVTGTISTNTNLPPEIDTPLVQAVGDSGSWTRAQIGMTATADGPMGSKVEVSGNDRISQSVSPYAPGGVRKTLETQALSGSVAATMPVDAHLDAKAGVSVSQSSTRSATMDADTGSHLQTAGTEASASLSWRAAKGVTLDTGVSVERQNADLDGDTANSASYSYVKPEALATVTPWKGGTVKLGVQRAVDPLNGANYMALANLSGKPQDLRIAPDHAWQYQASLDQKFGAAHLNAGIVQSQSGTATELAPVEGGQTPASVALKKKRKITLAVSLPLEAFGFSGAQIDSRATWRKSRVRDPVTGAWRRASGEAPREASLNLTKDLPAADAKIGLSGKLGTTRDFYQVNQSTQVHTAPRLGAFLSYTPGPVSMNLSVDGLMGGSQQFTDTLYNGSRNGPVSGVNTHRANDTHISFSLKRKL